MATPPWRFRHAGGGVLYLYALTVDEMWQTIILNLASGSLGVIVTLFLTVWWNRSDRRREQKRHELAIIVRYVQETDAALKRITALTAIPQEEMPPNHRTAVWEALTNFPVRMQSLGVDVFAQVTNAHLRFYANMNMANFMAAMHETGIDMSSVIARNPRLSPEQIKRYRPKEPQGWDTTLEAIQRALNSIDTTNNKMFALAYKKYAVKLSSWQRFQSWRLRKSAEKKAVETMDSLLSQE